MRRSFSLICFSILALGWLLISCAAAIAQESDFKQFPKYEVFGGYLAAGQAGEYSDFHFKFGVQLQSTFTSQHAAEASFLYNFNRVLGLKADFSLQPHHEGFPVNGSPVFQQASINPKLFNFLAGPEFKFRNHTRFTPFVHGLIGAAHATASFSLSGNGRTLSLPASETGFSTAVGGGADIRLSRRFSFRTGMDFNPVWVGRDDDGSRTVIKNVRLWGGILFH
jgi:opacity protein-like surface antigen